MIRAFILFILGVAVVWIPYDILAKEVTIMMWTVFLTGGVICAGQKSD